MPAPTRNYSAKFLTGDEFIVWLKSRGLSMGDAAEFFGVAPNTIRHYCTNGVTKSQALAIAAIERGLQPWRPSADDIERANRGVMQDEPDDTGHT